MSGGLCVGLCVGVCVGLFEDPAPASYPWNTLVNLNNWSYAWRGSTVFCGPCLWAG